MRLLKKLLEKDGSGSITLVPEESEDLWHIYNLICIGDRVRGTTIRRIQKETTTGSTDSERVRVSLTIEIEKVDFEPSSVSVRLSGKNIAENKFVKLGSFHTITLELQKEFTLAKLHWDSVMLDRVKTATDPAARADLAAIIMAEGLANICLITREMTLVRARIETHIPRKGRGNAEGHSKALEKFYEQVMQAMLRHLDFKPLKCVVVASPGFVRDAFLDYVWAQAAKRDELKGLFEHKPKFIKAHSSSGHKHALREALADPEILPKLQDTKALAEVKSLNEFYDMLRVDADRAAYGSKPVFLCMERFAIQTLLISDALFRSPSIATRQKYVGLVEAVRANGGEVRIFSSLHVSGEQLGQLCGLAAILRFQVTDIDDDDDEEPEPELAAPLPEAAEPVDAPGLAPENDEAEDAAERLEKVALDHKRPPKKKTPQVRVGNALDNPEDDDDGYGSDTDEEDDASALRPPSDGAVPFELEAFVDSSPAAPAAAPTSTPSTPSKKK